MDISLAETPAGFALTLTDESGVAATAELPHAKEPAKDSERALAGLKEGLAKLGTTIFSARKVDLDISAAWFLPASSLNALRRDAAEKLEAARLATLPRLPRRAAVEPPVPYPETELSYLANVLNDRARAFYQRHGVQLIEAAYEANEMLDDASLMITKHCLRYSFNLCPKEVKGIKPDPMTLINGKEKLTLRFDCKRCEMHVVGRIRKSVLDMPVVPIQFHAKVPDGYPKRRGLTRVPEQLAAGLTVAFGHDCVMDPWYSLGSADMLEVAHMGLHVAQMTSTAAMQQCFAAVTTAPAEILGLGHFGLLPGREASFVLLQARDTVEAIRLRAQRLGVWRRGVRLAESAPLQTTLHLPGRPAHTSFMR